MAMMISKFHKIIQSKVVWTVFAILISVAFVGVYTGAKSSGAKQQREAESKIAGRLFGEEVTQQEFGWAYRSIYISASMSMNRLLEVDPEIDAQLRQMAWERLATLKKAQEMSITVTPEQIRDTIISLPAFRNPQTGQYDADSYSAFVTGFLPRAGIDAKGFETMIAETIMIDKASKAAAQGALVTEDEIKQAFHLYSDKITVEYAALPRSLAGTQEVTEEEAKAYFDANPRQFIMPEKVMVNYVEFPVSDYTDSVTVNDEMITRFYEGNKQHYLKEGTEDAAPEYKPLEEVKGEITEMISSQLARQQAFNAADTLVAQLSNEATTFEAETKKAGLVVVSDTPAFGMRDTVKGVDPTAPFAQAAFNLEKTPTHYYSDPIVGKDSVYVIALHKKLKAFPLTFEMAKEEATESARIAAAEKAYIEKAEAVHADIETALDADTSFADAASKYSLEIVTTEPFSSSTQLEGDFGREIMYSTIHFDAGTLVDLIATPDEFLIAYVADKEIADEQQTLPAMRAELSAGIRQQKAATLAQAWRASVLEEAQLEDLLQKSDS